MALRPDRPSHSSSVAGSRGRSVSKARLQADRVRQFWRGMAQGPQRSTLQQLMLLPFSAQLLIATLLVLGLGYGVATRIIDQLSRELGQQIGERVLQEIKTQVNAPRQVNAINARLLSSGLIPQSRLLELAPLLQTELSAFPGLGYVQLASPDGSYLALERHQESCLLYTSPSPRDVEESRMPSSA